MTKTLPAESKKQHIWRTEKRLLRRGVVTKETIQKKYVGESSSPTKEIISFFISKTKEIKGFDPEINWGKDGPLIEYRLKGYSLEQLKDLIVWYLESKDSEKLGASLGPCLSTIIINRWKEDTI